MVRTDPQAETSHKQQQERSETLHNANIDNKQKDKGKHVITYQRRKGHTSSNLQLSMLIVGEPKIEMNKNDSSHKNSSEQGKKRKS